MLLCIILLFFYNILFRCIALFKHSILLHVTLHLTPLHYITFHTFILIGVVGDEMESQSFSSLSSLPCAVEVTVSTDTRTRTCIRYDIHHRYKLKIIHHNVT